MGLINSIKPLSTFLETAPLINLSNIDNFFLWNFLHMLGIKHRAAGRDASMLPLWCATRNGKQCLMQQIKISALIRRPKVSVMPKKMFWLSFFSVWNRKSVYRDFQVGQFGGLNKQGQKNPKKGENIEHKNKNRWRDFRLKLRKKLLWHFYFIAKIISF